MNTFYQAKFKELFLEFTRYLVEHPEFAEQIPEGAQVVFLDRNDPEFNRQSIHVSRRTRDTDDEPERPIVYVEVGELAPIRSRLQNPKVVASPPAYIAV
jgi:hypothetical protein